MLSVQELRISLATIVLGLLTASAFGALPGPTRTVTLAWSPSPSSTIAGYRVYLGPASQVYTDTVDAGNATTVTISNLIAGATYFFAVTAYDIIGLESDFSNEISYTVPTTANLQVSVSPSGEVLLSGTAPGGYQYEIFATDDLKSWTTIGSMCVDVSGFFQFTDPASSNYTMRCYRLRQIFPQ